MKVYRYIYTGLLTTLLIGWGCLLTACTDHNDINMERPDEPHPEEPVGESLRVASLTRGTGDTDDAVDPMKGEYVHLFLLAQGETTPSSGTVLYKGKDDTSTGTDITWDTPLYVKPGKDYEVFGFMPAGEATGTTAPGIEISGSTLTMTINGLNAVSKKDVCVVIGANTVGESITPGVFNYHAPENTEIGYGVDLLADHLYASAKFQFKVHTEYDKLRTIKLKKVVMKLNTESTKLARVNATVTMTKGATTGSPITSVVLEQPETGDAFVEQEIFSDNTGEKPGYALEVEKTKDISVYFAPAYKGDLVMVSTYDVYDKHGNKTREDCTAENSLNNILNVSSVTRGAQMVIPLMLRPTYVYVLSEPDWDYDYPSVETE